jgi:hypothetical protein
MNSRKKSKGDIILEIVLLEYWTFSQMLSDNNKHIYEIWSRYIKKKEVILKKQNKKNNKDCKLKGGNSDNFCTRVVNLVTYDVVDDQKLTSKVWSKYLKKERTYSEKALKLESEILKFSLFVAIATRIFNIGRKKSMCIISRLSATHISSFIKIFSVPFALSLDPVYVLNLPYFSLFIAIATRIFNIRRKGKNVHNFITAIYPYTKFHKNIFSTLCVIQFCGLTDGLTDRRTEGKPEVPSC